MIVAKPSVFLLFCRVPTYSSYIAQLGDTIVIVEMLNGTIHVWDHWSDQPRLVGKIANGPLKRQYGSAIKMTNRWLQNCTGIKTIIYRSSIWYFSFWLLQPIFLISVYQSIRNFAFWDYPFWTNDTVFIFIKGNLTILTEINSIGAIQIIRDTFLVLFPNPPPPPCVTFFNFLWLIFRLKLLWII